MLEYTQMYWRLGDRGYPKCKMRFLNIGMNVRLWVMDEKGPGWWLLRHTLIQYQQSPVISIISFTSATCRFFPAILGPLPHLGAPSTYVSYKLGTLLRDQLSFTNLQLTPFLHIPTTKICGTRRFGSVRKDSCFSRQPRLKIKKAPV